METVNSHNPKPPIAQERKSSCYKLIKSQNLNCKIPLKMYHQNIRGLRCKSNELISHLQQILPLILCLTEHHAHREEPQQIFMDEYKLAAYFCRMLYAKGGVCMYVHKSLEAVSVDIESYCKEKDLESCAIKLNFISIHICTIAIYRASSGNFNFFYK